MSVSACFKKFNKKDSISNIAPMKAFQQRALVGTWVGGRGNAAEGAAEGVA